MVMLVLMPLEALRQQWGFQRYWIWRLQRYFWTDIWRPWRVRWNGGAVTHLALGLILGWCKKKRAWCPMRCWSFIRGGLERKKGWDKATNSRNAVIASGGCTSEQNVESVAFVMGKDRRDEYIAKIDSLHLYHWNHVKPVEVKVRSLTNLCVL